ncbi:cytochrome P450, cyclodipeptide synthase-associated [Rhodococcoides fascians]|uniref:cytochrome P450, cyclodipeptide synthase-associated n=1 Tax=Rhodococcoides fascians TaxID=1828 RepID=UPI001E5E83AA|nr:MULTISPECIES: cytochrome P450, cyclodipeptide synthase-associated [Rhodococcus]
MTTMPLSAPLDILSSDFQSDPYPYYDYLRTESPVHYVPDLDVYLLSRYQDVRAALRDRRFTTAPLATRAEPVMRGVVLAQMEGSEHAAKHRLVVRGLTNPDALARHAEIVDRTARDLLTPHLASGRIDLVNDFGKDFAVLVTLQVLGLPTDDYKQIAQWHAGVADFITSITFDDERYNYDLDCSARLADVITPVIESRKNSPRSDLISALCVPDVDGVVMTTTEILALCLNVLAAATEPADKTLGMLFRHLLSNPDQFALVRDDHSYIQAAIAETLRLTPPVQIIPRQLDTAVTVEDTTIPAESVVFMMIGAANRDPAAFENPDRFDLRRTDLSADRSFTAAAQHMAFGTGIHACVGAAFARDEIATAASIVLDLLPDLALAEPDDYQETGLYTRGPKSLLLDFTPAR